MSKKSKWEELKEFYTLWPYCDWSWRWRNFINLIDDPVDDLKHKLHGMRIFGWTLYLPKWLMSGSGEADK
jgi:hypothetical protein